MTLTYRTIYEKGVAIKNVPMELFGGVHTYSIAHGLMIEHYIKTYGHMLNSVEFDEILSCYADLDMKELLQLFNLKTKELQ